MTDRPPPSEPLRLSDEPSDMAALLRRAEREFQKTVDESGAWRRMERARRHRVQLSWALAASALAAGITLVSIGASSLRANRDTLALYPEPMRQADVREGPEQPSVAVPAPELVREPAPAPYESLPLHAPRASVEPRGEADCKKLGSAGKIERAVDCFRDLSQGDGLKAEVALYEAARLTAERLQDSTRALGMLDEHRRRFPEGALRGEMEWLRVQALQRTGRHDDALAASEALLATPVGRKLAPELHWLRGKILQDAQGDCARAVSEFVSLVGEPGARGDDAEMRRAQCLDRLGRDEDARTAYEQYLRRPDPARAAEARTRLSALK